MKSSNLTKLFSTAAILGALATPAVAQEEGITIPGATAEVTLDYVTQYFFRGYEQSNTDTGGSFQPGASMTLPVVDDVTATIGTWGAFEFDAPAANGNPSAWYEQDVYGSIDATFGNLTVGAGLTLFTYPALGNNGVVEATLSASFDDSDLLGDFAFNPTVLIAHELNNTNTNVAGGKEATYLQLSGAFSIPTEGTAIEDWTWEVPVVVGMSLDDYYNDASGAEEWFGFVSVGLSGSIAMADLIGTDEYFGAWSLNVGVTVLFLNSDVSGGAGNGGFGLVDNTDDTSDNMQLIGSIGLSRSW